MLFTDNRKQQGEGSLQATLNDSWRPGHLAVMTLSDKEAFRLDRGYAERVANSIADLLYGMHDGEHHDQP